MRKLIEATQQHLIVCDNINCDYTIPYMEDIDTIIYINKPCPKCRENLLTERDYLDHKKLKKRIDWINRWFSWLTVFSSEKHNTQTIIRVKVHNGIKITEENGEN